ncbi:MAG: Lrp/AsnC family transcriptional regulator [Candidatus Aenigmarchaeota archaeon]|nr:Lrp/AsnC family transcriptional regulator [Candidatus Aenigmarchaeota archaeon]
MDTLDKKILCEMDLNCRTPISKIAKNLRIGRDVVAYRIKKLENKDIITKYICSVNLGLLGYKTYKIYFKISRNWDDEKKFVERLISSKSVIHMLKTEGSFDYTVSVAVKNIMDLDDFLMEIKSDFKYFVKEYVISILVYSKIFKLDKLLLDQKKCALKLEKFEKYSGEDKTIAISEKERILLKTLSQEANQSIVDISKRTRLSIDVVKYNLKKLGGNIVNSYRVMFNLNQMGYHHYVIMIRTWHATKDDEKKLIAWCLKKKNVLFCTKRIGHFDFEINVAIKDIDDLNCFLSEFKADFDDIIDTYNTIINSKLLKLNYVPF